MKLKNTISIAAMLIILALITGCQDQLKQDFASCQQENTDLKAKVQQQKQTLEQMEKAIQNSSMLIAKILGENEKLRNQVETIKKELESKSQTKDPVKKPEMTPEQKERLRKGIEELRRLQKESAEKMRREKLEKEGKK